MKARIIVGINIPKSKDATKPEKLLTHAETRRPPKPRRIKPVPGKAIGTRIKALNHELG